jgi:mono/diheme cytochrome c family protein
MGQRLGTRAARGSFLVLGFLASAVHSGEAEGPRQVLIERGRSLYAIHCASCHGASLEGNGPLAKDLDTSPADLTRISQRNGGEFPLSRLYRTVEGADDVAEHKDRDMPRWGLVFQETGGDADQRDEVRARILQIIYYIESAQVESGASPGPK